MGANDKLLLVGGCSFTAQPDEKKLSWAWQLKEDLRVGPQLLNTAEMASGNQIIFDRLAYELSKPETLDMNPAVLCMWSSPLRKEFLMTHTDPDYRNAYNGVGQGFTNYILKDNVYHDGTGGELKHPMSNWLIVGGGYGVWNYGIPSLDGRLKNYYEGMYNIPQCYVDTCRAIVGLQTLCQTLNVPLVNMCWMNIFHDLHEWDGYDKNKTSINATAGWMGRRLYDEFANKTNDVPDDMTSEYHNKAIQRKYPDTKHWVDMIDWDTWFFYENDRVKKGGLAEFSYFECNTPAKKMWEHPSTTVQRKWKTKVKQELKRRKLLG